MTKLSVNVNKIATLRNARGGNAPDLLEMCWKIVSFGAQGITIHPRADQRHITLQDAHNIGKARFPVETNFEGDLREDFVHLVLEQKPTQCTLVPSKHGEVTSNHGWDLKKSGFLLAPVVSELKKSNIRVSLFLDAGDVDSVTFAKKLGVDRIEIYTEPFAVAFAQGKWEKAIKDIRATIDACSLVGLGVNAGHDLTHVNLPVLLQACPEILEVSIGHHLMCHALEVGMKQAVTDYLTACR